MTEAQHRCCVIIPAYCEAARIGDVVKAVKQFPVDLVVVDDGSTDNTAQVAEEAGAIVLRHEKNKGKGAALNTGFEYARQKGYEILITMDADGQHKPEEIPRFLDAYDRFHVPVLVGNRMWNPSGMPWIRRATNRFMSALLSACMKQYVPDTQCGFRLYQVNVLSTVPVQSARFDAESEILLNIAAQGIEIGSVRISSVYGQERSKIRPIRDTVRFFRMLWRYWQSRRWHK